LQNSREKDHVRIPVLCAFCNIVVEFQLIVLKILPTTIGEITLFDNAPFKVVQMIDELAVLEEDGPQRPSEIEKVELVTVPASDPQQPRQ
jgi:hypothetical protein